MQFDRGTLGFGYGAASGNLIRITAPGNDSLTFSYDGSLPTKVVWAGALRDSVQVTYDSVLRVKTQTVHGTSTVGFSYDRDGLLVGAGALRLGRSGTTGLLLADTLGPVRGSYGYTSRGELAGLHQSRGGTTLLGTGYVRDSLGRLTQLTDSVRDAGGTLQVRRWSYVYDGVGRLLRDSLDGVLHQAVAYDSNGNRTSLTSASGTVSSSYDAQDRLVRSATSGGTVIRYAYGSNGELQARTDSLSGAQTRYRYDALGNLRTVVLPSGDSVEYLIDGQNRRVGRKYNGAVTHRWLYQNQLNPVAELDSTGALVSRFVYGSRANVPDYLVKGGNVYRLLTDHLGSVRAVVDTATGTVAQWTTYDAWGNALAGSGAGFQPFGFAGGLTDSATGLVRFGARDYDPVVGRWTAKDPIGFASRTGGLYSYAANDPTNHVDLDGQFWETVADAASFGLSVKDFICSPGWGSGLWAAADGLALLVPFLPAPGWINRGMRVANGLGDAYSSAKVERVIARGEKVADLMDEMRQLQYSTNMEHALVKLSSGERAIVSGGRDGIQFAEGQITKLYAHTQPARGIGIAGPSAAALAS